jgi:hypothetical protein
MCRSWSAGAWSWSLSVCCWGWECAALFHHFAVHLHGIDCDLDLLLYRTQVVFTPRKSIYIVTKLESILKPDIANEFCWFSTGCCCCCCCQRGTPSSENDFTPFSETDYLFVVNWMPRTVKREERSKVCNSEHSLFLAGTEYFRSRIRMEPCSILILLESSLQTCMAHTIAECTVNNCWWWTEELSETCRVSFPK